MTSVNLDIYDPAVAEGLLLSRVERCRDTEEKPKLTTLIGWYPGQWVVHHPDLHGSTIGTPLVVGSLIPGRNRYRPDTSFLTFVCSGEPTKAFRCCAEMEKYIGSICYLKPRPDMPPRMGIVANTIMSRWLQVSFDRGFEGVYAPESFIKIERPDALARLPDKRQVQLTLF